MNLFIILYDRRFVNGIIFLIMRKVFVRLLLYILFPFKRFISLYDLNLKVVLT